MGLQFRGWDCMSVGRIASGNGELKDPGCSSHVPSQCKTSFIDWISQALTMTYSSMNHDAPTDRDRLQV